MTPAVLHTCALAPFRFTPAPQGALALSSRVWEELRSLALPGALLSRTEACQGRASGSAAVAAAIRFPSGIQPRSSFSFASLEG